MIEKVTWKTLTILLFYCLFSFSTNAQNRQTGKISCPEKRWALFHPFIARQSYSLTKDALQVADSIKNTGTLDGDINGGQEDAFKHAYWMALLSQHIKYRKALKLGKVHEKGNYKSFKKSKRKGIQASHDKVSSIMDLWNNQKGLEIGLELKDQDLIIIQLAIIDSIQSGVMKIIYKNVSGQFLDCEGNIIPADSLIGKWENEKCLVPSDRIVNRE
jgi:hypothetical protein